MLRAITLFVFLGVQSVLACTPSNKVLEYNNAVTCNRQTGSKEVDFRFNTPEKVLVKIKDINVTCAGKGTTYFFSWVTFDLNGNVTNNVKFENEIINTPGTKQALRVNILEPEKCGYFMLEFSSDFVSVYP